MKTQVRTHFSGIVRHLYFVRCCCFFFGLILLRLCVVLGCAATRQPAPPTIAQAESTTDEKIGPLQLRDIGFDQVLEVFERWTGKTVLRPQSLPATTLTLNLKEEVTKEQAIRAVETLLSMNGIALTPLDDQFLKVTALNAAKVEAPELITGSTLGLRPSGRLASKLFKPKFLRVAEFMPQVAGLINGAIAGAPVIFEKANTALITDSISNLQRVENLLLQLDQPDVSGMHPKFYTLTHAKASEVVGKLHSILSGAQQSQLGSATNYNADDRTNQIVLFSDPQQYPVFDDLIARLDVRSGQDTRNELIYLKHATAKDVATILTQLVTGQNSATRNAGADSIRRNPLASSTQPNLTATSSLSAQQEQVSEPTNQFSPYLTVLPEERSNALVVSGTVDDIRLISEMAAKFDVLLPQVRIEVVIAEVTLDDNDTTGISALGLQVSGDKLIGFSGSLPGLSVTNGTVTRPDASASSGTGITGPWDLAAQITLGATPRKTNTNILSVPNIITTHNREGRIFVGEQVPVISGYLNTGTSGTTAGGVGSGYLSTVSSKDIGIQLVVKPLIGADGSVQLAITQDVNDILGYVTIDGNSQPIVGRRSTDSFVSARSGEIIVLGGLQRTSLSHSTNRLGPIPILGDLLGARTREKTRTDLVFFLRPTILVNTPADNNSAMAQVEQFPKAHRDEVKKMLQPKPLAMPPASPAAATQKK